jgi:hypothetical protein
MIILHDEYRDGSTAVVECATWDEAADLFQTAPAAHLAACSIRDLTSGKYLRYSQNNHCTMNAERLERVCR